MPQLLTNSAASGASASAAWGGGPGQFEVAGAFNGATATLQAKGLDGTYTDVANTALTAGGRALFQLPPCSIRVNVSVATPTSISAAAWRIRNP